MLQMLIRNGVFPLNVQYLFDLNLEFFRRQNLRIRASSYESGNRDEFCGVFIWEISARSTGMNSRNATKTVEHKFVLFATVIALLAVML